MKSKLTNQIGKHPIIAMLTTAVVSSVATCQMLLAALGKPVDWWLPVPYLCIALGLLMVRHGSRKMVVPALILAMALPSKAEEPLPWVVGGGLLILIVGGIAGCKAARKCAKIAQARTNAWPEELDFHVADGNTYAAYSGWMDTGYCPQERESESPVVFTLSIAVNEDRTVTTTATASTNAPVESFAEFQFEQSAIGLTIGDGESFSRNGQACAAEDVPIRFTADSAVIGQGGVMLTVEQSDDLVTWLPMARINVPLGQRLEFEDVSHGMMFYRTTSSEP